MNTGGQETFKASENRYTNIRNDVWLSQSMYYACPIFTIVFPVKSHYLLKGIISPHHTK